MYGKTPLFRFLFYFYDLFRKNCGLDAVLLLLMILKHLNNKNDLGEVKGVALNFLQMMRIKH